MDKPATDWASLKNLVAEALALAPPDREAMLERIAAEDGQLAAEARRILACDAEDDFLIPPHADDGAPQRLIGARVGSYRVEALCGAGGMGHVYRVVRLDGAYEAVAALKVLRHDLLARPLLRRFAIERQALARLAHPRIARLLDAGSLDDGRPWLLMEWIEGVPIDVYVQREKLSIRGRIELMVQASRAVQFAHENLVIHRDLKPSNIFVDASGSVRLLDFGVAKLLDDPISGGQTTLGALTRFLTPAYASPEQLTDEPLTTASDVYSLGVILFELLTGRRPFPMSEGRDLQRWHSMVTSHDPPTPSSVLRRSDDPSRRREARQLRGDLDNVVLNALRAEARQRYRSAGELADDLERYLAGLPVRATPQTWRYRVSKFVRRNRIGVGVGLAAAAAAAIGVGGITYHARVLAQERDRALAAQMRAESAHDAAERVSEFLQTLLASARPDRDGDDVTVRQVLARAADQLDALQDEPDVEATLRTTIGSAYVAMGDFTAAEPHLTRALELRRAGAADPVALGEALNNLAALRHRQRRCSDALPLAREALEVQSLALPPTDPRVSTSVNNLAAIERCLGHLDEAERLHRQVLATRRQVLGENHADVAQSLNNLAMVLIERNRLDEAYEALDQALGIRESLFGRRHPEVAQTLYNLGVVDQRAARLEQALDRFQAALTIEREVFDDDHPALALTLGQIGVVHLGRGDSTAAVRPLREAMRIYTSVLPPDDLRIQNQRLLLARALAGSEGDHAEALVLLREAADVLDSTVGADHPLTREVRAELDKLSPQPISRRP